MTISGSTVTGWAALYMKGQVSSAGSAGSTVTIDGSTLTARNVYSGISNEFGEIVFEDNNISVNITNSTLNVYGESNTQALALYNGKSGNTVSLGEGNTVNVTGAGCLTYDMPVTSTMSITGGTFTVDPSAYVAPGYMAVQSGGTWTVQYMGVAKIGNTGYATLQAAVDAAQNGDTIDILQDIQLTTVSSTVNGESSIKYNVVVEKGITLDGHGHSITAGSNKRPLALAGIGKEIVLKDLTVKAKGATALWLIASNMTVTLDNTVIDGTGFATGLDSYNQVITIGSDFTGIRLNVTKGSVIKTNEAGSSHYDIIVWSPSTINVSNSTLKGWANVYIKNTGAGSTVNISNSSMVSQGTSGASNNFALITMESSNNIITLDNNTAAISQPADNTYNTLLLFGSGVTGNTVKIINGTSYSSPDVLYGGFTFNWSRVAGNNVYFDAGTKDGFSSFFGERALYTISNIMDNTEHLYPLVIKEASVVDNGVWYYYSTLAGAFSSEHFKQQLNLYKDITLSADITVAKTDGYFIIVPGSYVINANGHAILINDEVSAIWYKDQSVDIFGCVNEYATLLEEREDSGAYYAYTAVPPVAMIGSTGYESLAAAVAAAQSGDTIELVADDNVSLTSGGEIEINKPLTITGAVDSNGVPKYTVYGQPSVTSNYNDVFLNNSTGGTITISNIAFSGFGNETAASYHGRAPLFIGSSNRNAVIENVYISEINTEAIHINGGTFSITNCAIDCDKESGYTRGIYVANDASGTITNTNVSNVVGIDGCDTAAIELQGDGPISISDCELFGAEANNHNMGIAAGSAGGLTPGSSSVVVSRCSVSAYIAIFGDGDTGASIAVNSGEYVGYIVPGDNGQGITITSGTFNDPTALNYGTVGSTMIVSLEQDWELDSSISPGSGTLDLNGYTISVDENTCDPITMNKAGATLTITGNGTIDASGYSGNDGTAIWAKAGSVIIESGTVINKSTEEATLYVSGENASITVQGGTFRNIAEGEYKWKAGWKPVILNVKNTLNVNQIQVSGGNFYCQDPSLGDDNLGGSFLVAGKTASPIKESSTVIGYSVQ